MESDLLNQVRIVSVGDVLPVWIQKNLCIRIKVGELSGACSIGSVPEFEHLKLLSELHFHVKLLF